ncbi:MAG TPA: hypothetical protein VNM90_14265 [Haliangium sp.]|nr:hypothetical protein [Haliangium sp.]
MQYIFQDHPALAPETANAFYEISLRWAAEHGTAFVLTMYPRDYGRAADIERFAALGAATWMHRPGEEVVEVIGAVGEELVDTLFESLMPMGAITGDLCPVGDLRVMRGQRTLYRVSEYGRDQVFELTDDELAALGARLFEAGLGAELLAPMPLH